MCIFGVQRVLFSSANIFVLRFPFQDLRAFEREVAVLMRRAQQQKKALRALSKDGSTMFLQAIRVLQCFSVVCS